MTKDWTGNKRTAWSTLGASNHSGKERQENDYYATDPRAVAPLLDNEKFSHKIWECAVGGGHIAEELERHGYEVYGSDIIDRGWKGVKIMDFLGWIPEGCRNDIDIITNPPFERKTILRTYGYRRSNSFKNKGKDRLIYAEYST